MSDDLQDTSLTILVLWLALNVFGGCVTADINKCNTEFNRRIEYIFPGNLAWCWLLEDISGGEE